MSMEQIAKRAGVGKPTLYRRWSTKEALVADAIETLVTADVTWPTRDEIAATPTHQLVKRNILRRASVLDPPRAKP